MSRRYPMWLIRWNAARTVGLVWRVRDWGGRPKAPCLEGIVRRGLLLKD